MHMKIMARFPENRQNAAIWLLLGLLAQSVLWISPGHAATYRCHDEYGTRVLTDNPAQLLNCTILQSQSSSTINEGPPTSNIQNAKSDAPNLPHHDSQVTDKLVFQEEGNPDSQPSGDITVPLTKSGGSLVVQVMLSQERSAQLIVDTGASMTVLSTQAAIDLGILGTTDNELLTVNTAGGSVQVNMNYLPSLTVGTAQVTNVAVVIHDLPDIPEHIEGLLGMSFLKHFLVTLDAEHSRLILRPKQQQ